ncbi:MAG: hypothetical protein ABH835_03705 [Patescibacteria group bacterium]|nr:hypothetical protein [Patescibacteria group bacterium]
MYQKRSNQMFLLLLIALVVALFAIAICHKAKAQATEENTCVEVRITDPDPYPIQLKYRDRVLGMMLIHHQIPACTKETDREYKVTVSLFYGLDTQLCAFCLYLFEKVDDKWELLYSGYMYKVARMPELLSGVEEEFQESFGKQNDNNQ